MCVSQTIKTYTIPPYVIDTLHNPCMSTTSPPSPSSPTLPIHTIIHFAHGLAKTYSQHVPRAKTTPQNLSPINYLLYSTPSINSFLFHTSSRCHIYGIYPQNIWCDDNCKAMYQQLYTNVISMGEITKNSL